MKPATKKKLYKFLAIATLVLGLIALVIYAIHRFFKFITSGTIEGTLWGIGVIVVPILLLIFIGWSRGQLYEAKRARINLQAKEKREEGEEPKRTISKRKLLFPRHRLNSDGDVMYDYEYSHAVQEREKARKKKENKVAFEAAKRAGLDVCEKCGTPEPSRCSRYKNHCQICNGDLACCHDAYDDD